MGDISSSDTIVHAIKKAESALSGIKREPQLNVVASENELLNPRIMQDAQFELLITATNRDRHSFPRDQAPRLIGRSALTNCVCRSNSGQEKTGENSAAPVSCSFGTRVRRATWTAMERMERPHPHLVRHPPACPEDLTQPLDGRDEVPRMSASRSPGDDGGWCTAESPGYQL